MGQYEHYSLGRRNLQSENHWEELGSNFRITKPTVLCFGGNGTVSAKDANAMCKIGQGLVGIKPPTGKNEFATTCDVDFIGISYGVDSVVGNGALTDEEREELVQSLFMPLCLDEKGALLSKEQMMKNFNQITFFSHCYGSEEISNLIEKSFEQMLSLGIDEKTSNEVLNQMFTISYAPIKKCEHPNLQVVPVKDELLESGPANSPITNKFLEDRLNGKGSTSGGTVAFKEDEVTVSVLTSAMTKDLTHEHSVRITIRDDDWKFKESLPVYGDEVSQVMGYALASSVANSIQNYNSDTFVPKPSADTFLEGAKSILDETQNEEFEQTIEQIKREQGSQQDEETSEITQPIVTETTLSVTPLENLQGVDYSQNINVEPEQ